MSGHDDLGGPTGFFDHLDDPVPPTPARTTLDSVMNRGRRLRARRHAIVGASSAAAVTVLVLGGLGLSRAITADRSHDTLIPPANSATPTASLLPGPHKSGHGNGPVAVAPRAGGHRPNSSPSAGSPSPGPCDLPSESPSAEPAKGPLPEATLPPLVPSPTVTPCPSESPSESPAPSESPSESPSDSAEPTTSPS